MISTSDYESAGLSSIPGKDSRRTAHPAVHHLAKSINGYRGKFGKGKLWNIRCHSSPVFLPNGLFFITGSKAYMTGDGLPQPRSDAQLYSCAYTELYTACAPTLPLYLPAPSFPHWWLRCLINTVKFVIPLFFFIVVQCEDRKHCNTMFQLSHYNSL